MDKIYLFNSFADTLKIDGIEDLNSKLSTNSFYLDNNSNFQFKNYYYSLQKETKNILKENEKIIFRLELVSEDNKSIGKIREMKYDNKSLADSSTVDIKVDCSNLKSGKYFLRIVAETDLQVEFNIVDVQYEDNKGLKKTQQTELKFEGIDDINKFELSQNYPNPFNPQTTINYQLTQEGLVTLKVYDILGEEVITLVNDYKTQGKHSVIFDGRNLSSGIYFYKITAGSFVDTKKFILMK